jgi:hypothetical protein
MEASRQLLFASIGRLCLGRKQDLTCVHSAYTCVLASVLLVGSKQFGYYYSIYLE